MRPDLIVFRADGGPTMGGGHIARCLALAEELRGRGWRCAFAVSPETAATMHGLAASGYEVFALPENSGPGLEAAAIAANWTDGVAVLVADHYQRDRMFEGPARPWTDAIVVLDDLADRRHDCDLLVDATLGRKPEHYGGDAVPETCRMLLGTDYALLKPAFAALRPGALERRRAPELRRVLLSFGSTDPLDATGYCLEALAKSGLMIDIDVVLGAAAPRLAQIRNRVAGLPRATLHVETDAMAELMAQADCALGGAGSTSWERCCLGLPTLAAILADNQLGIAAALAAAGAARIAGPWRPALAWTMVEELGRLTPQRLARMSSAAAAVCDGLGTKRVADAIEQLRPRRT
jgi:UDP-2,4-diacetamido-2,4,6-trideoxy-beta-L-altropyranose hydrolase